MVARGDLGLEMPLERVPRVQKEILRKARARGVPVIVATQVLESMRTEPRPTRAEASDAAGAVDGGADAIMLSGETATGFYPVRSVEVLDAIIRDAEIDPAAGRPSRRRGDGGRPRHGALRGRGVVVARVRRPRDRRRHARRATPRGCCRRFARGDHRGRHRQAGGRAPPQSLARRVADRLRLERRHRTGDHARRRTRREANAPAPENATMVVVNTSADLDRGSSNFVRIRAPRQLHRTVHAVPRLPRSLRQATLMTACADRRLDPDPRNLADAL